jgi:polyhydroxyalkanoate synthesis regulator phasin
MLITIGEAYNEAKNQSDAADPLMEKHKGTLRNQLKTVDDRIKVITDNAREAENELYEKLEKALETLHALTQTKLNVLLADQIELRRRYEEIQWAESFLKYQREALEPQSYLKAWFRYVYQMT